MNIINALSILESIFGKSKKQSKGNYLFHCPACNHYKPKLSINLDPSRPKFQQWSCWVCRETHNTKGRSLYHLLKKFNASPEQIREMNEAIGERSYTYTQVDKIKTIQLPTEYIVLWNSKDTIAKRHVMVELNRRHISSDDILRYQIGYCETGEYANRIIIPSHDENGSLNYFIARSYFKDTKLKYKNPEVSKNIIVFEMFINWDLPNVIICEGIFDAIAIRRNVIPLLGKSMSNVLYEKIIRKNLNIIIYLDYDAIQDSIKLSEKLYNQGINVYLAIPPKNSDPGDLSFEQNLKIINTAEKMDLQKIIKYKLKI